jgi:hypothetical protein
MALLQFQKQLRPCRAKRPRPAVEAVHSSTISSCAGCVVQALVLSLNSLPEHIFEFVEKKETDAVEWDLPCHHV